MIKGLTGSEIEALISEFKRWYVENFNRIPHSINSMHIWASSNYPLNLNEYTKALNYAIPLLWKHCLNGIEYEKGDYSFVYEREKDY